MKDRARKIGESGGFNLLKSLQQNSKPAVRFHLVGHSFGCIVASAIVNGPQGKGILVRPVNSVVLIQGALSLWSYANKIEYANNRPGYFHPIVTQKKVSGAIITTYSSYDYAVGKMYPLAGKVVFSSVDFAPGDELPKYGGIGSFGIGGEDLQAEYKSIKEPLDFKPGKIYNLQSSRVIKNVQLGGPTSGAHCDIVHPEVAHVVWLAADVI
jgi:pimeloyl-ACP methyl ester carboxylesterase